MKHEQQTDLSLVILLSVLTIALIPRSCVVCNTVPACPACAADEVCSMTTQTCDSCSTTFCQKLSQQSGSGTSSTASPSHSSKAGAIAGGVVGGIVVLAIITGFIIWRFYYIPRSKHRALSATTNSRHPSMNTKENYTNHNEEYGDIENVSTQHHSPGGSLSTQHPEMLQVSSVQSPITLTPNTQTDSRISQATLSSIATSQFTRSSNIIPIAYIPGVTSRSGPEEIPPVPKINLYGDQFFSAEDILRGSFLSDDGTATTRSSIASDSYRGSTAVISSAMMTAIQAKPNLVAIGGRSDSVAPLSITKTNSITEPGPLSPVEYGSARAVSGQRVNAHSIRIGRGNPVGLQSEYIEEEEDEEDEYTDDEDEDEDDEDDEDEDEEDDEESEAGSDGSISLVSHSIADSHVSTEDSLRSSLKGKQIVLTDSRQNLPISRPLGPGLTNGRDRQSNASSGTESGYDIPLVIDISQGIEKAAIPSRKASTSRNRNSRMSQLSRKSSDRYSRASRDNGDDYVMDLPIEAVLYAVSYSEEDLQGRSSPFDDKYHV